MVVNTDEYHQSVITYEEARKRLGDEVSEANDDFEQLSGGGGSMSFDVFLGSFLGSVFPTVPKELASALFRAFDITHAGTLGKEDFVRGLAVLRYGTAEERIHLVFTAYDTRRCGRVSKQDLLDYLKLFPDDDVALAQELQSEIQRDVKSGGSTSLSLKQFSAWVRRAAARHPDDPLSVVVWMYEFEDLLKRQGIRAHHHDLVSTGRQTSEMTSRTLAELTGLSHAKVSELQSVHRNMQARSSIGVVDEKTFNQALPSIPDNLKAQLFKALDVTKSGSVSLRELLTAVAICSHGSPEEKLAFCFRLFDSEEKGSLRKDEFVKMVKSLWNVETLYRCASGRNDVGSLMSPRDNDRLGLLLRTAFPEGKEHITTDEFLSWVAGHQIGVQFVQAVWQLAFIDLHVRPTSPREEKELVEQLNGTKYHPLLNTGPEGSIWCLIDYGWWQEWQQSVEAGDSDPASSTGAASWVGATRSMPQLDNSKLLDSSGHLRRNIDWGGEQGGKHYEVISQGAWRALASWYGALPNSEIPRKVVEIDGRKQLELHAPRLLITRGTPLYEGKGGQELSFSCITKLNEVKEAAATMYGIPPEDAVLWERQDDGWRRSCDSHKSLVELDIADGSCFMVGSIGGVLPVKFTSPDGDVTISIARKEGSLLFLVDGRHYPPVQTIEHVVTDKQSYLKCTDFHVKLPVSSSPAVLDRVKKLAAISGADFVSNTKPVPSEKTSLLEQDVASLICGTRIECHTRDKAGKQSGPTKATVLHLAKQEVKVVPFHSEVSHCIPASWVLKKLSTRDEKNSYGRVGLQNLTNTCYLNSTVQALSHTRLLRDFFVSGRYKYDLNRSSQWGMGGKVAVCFSELLERLWTTDKQFLAPRNFRSLIGTFRAEFATYQQQDANDFLLALLEGLGEDVNRVRDKKSIPLKLKPEDSTDAQLAAESWNAHVAREDSFFTGLFAWQHKSVRQCGGCGKVTRRVDTALPPLSLALPSPDNQFVKVALHRPAEKVIHMTIKLDLKGTTSQLTEAVSRMLQYKVPASNLVALELAPEGYTFELPVWRGKDEVGKKLQRMRPGSMVHMYEARDYHLGNLPEGPKRFLTQAVHRRLTRVDKLFAAPWKPQLFGTPLMLCITGGSGAYLYHEVWKQVKQLVPDYVLEAEPTENQEGGEHQRYNYPFLLTRITVDGMTCSDCGWLRGCIGCKIEDSDAPHSVMHRDTIGIDWDVSVFETEYKASIASSYEEHDTIASCKQEEDSEQACELSSCLHGFFETNAKLDRIACESCKEVCPHTQTVRAWGLPPILVIQLKRFTWSTEAGGQKIKTAVNFPIVNLDLKQYLAADMNPPFDEDLDSSGYPKLLSRFHTAYDLYAVINHEGARTSWGHYYCFVKLFNNKWCQLNDSLCASIPESQVVTEKAYILFYQRKDLDNVPLETLWPRVPEAKPVNIAEVKRAVWKAGPGSASPSVKSRNGMKKKPQTADKSCQACIVL